MPKIIDVKLQREIMLNVIVRTINCVHVYTDRVKQQSVKAKKKTTTKTTTLKHFRCGSINMEKGIQTHANE